MKTTAPVQVELKDVEENDLAVFFKMEMDPDAIHMAAFTSNDPADRDAFMAHWNKILGDATIVKKTIVLDGRPVGYVCSFERAGEREVSYWIEKSCWGKGIATQALSNLLSCVPQRPIYARAAKDNVGSIRVLQRCGFVVCGYDRYFANGRGRDIAEAILKLL